MERLVKLSGNEWERLRPLLPPEKSTGGRPPKPHRPMIEGMLWVLRTGAPWRDLPNAYGPWQSVYTRFSRWSRQGLWQHILKALGVEADTEGYAVDSSHVRVHQDGTGAAYRSQGEEKKSPTPERNRPSAPRRRHAAKPPKRPKRSAAVGAG